MNLVLFNQIKEQVLAEPKLVNMKFFCRKAEKACNTAGCIGGWAMFLCGMKPLLIKAQSDDKLELNRDRIAAALLDIPFREAQELFYFFAKTGGYHEENPYYALALELEHKRQGSLSYAKTVVKALDLCLERVNSGNAYIDND